MVYFLSLFSLENVQWKLIAMDATEDVIKYPCCPEPFTNIIFRLIVTRKPLYLLVNLIAPNLIFSVLTVVVFTLPSEAGSVLLVFS